MVKRDYINRPQYPRAICPKCMTKTFCRDPGHHEKHWRLENEEETKAYNEKVKVEREINNGNTTDRNWLVREKN